MLDGGRIIGGVTILLLLSVGPAWVASVHARISGTPPMFANQGPCVEPRAAMLREHPKILNQWREQAVRHGVRQYRSSDGQTFPASLNGGCLHCHQSAPGFCTRCHAEVGISLNCWSCHKDSPDELPSLTRSQQSSHFPARMRSAAYGWPGMR
jgi:hypothetical protein